jgi:hypothetical protein
MAEAARFPAEAIRGVRARSAPAAAAFRTAGRIAARQALEAAARAARPAGTPQAGEYGS